MSTSFVSIVHEPKIEQSVTRECIFLNNINKYKKVEIEKQKKHWWTLNKHNCQSHGTSDFRIFLIVFFMYKMLRDRKVL